MKVGVIIFIVLICGIVLVELVSLIKKIQDNARAKRQRVAKMNAAIQDLEVQHKEVKTEVPVEPVAEVEEKQED